jgi:hypothetical protein
MDNKNTVEAFLNIHAINMFYVKMNVKLYGLGAPN